MSNNDVNQARAIFSDPVAYLASYGIEATLVEDPATDPALPAAA